MHTRRVNVCFVGAGAMATAIARGMAAPPQAAAALATPFSYDLGFVDAHASQLDLTRTKIGVMRSALANTTEAAHMISSANVVMLAVKPQVAAAVARSIRLHLNPRTLLISVMAGTTIQKLQQWFVTEKNAAPRIVRVMPNAALLSGHGASGFAMGPGATDEDEQLVSSIFSASGFCAKVNEDQLDAVTALSGSGPAMVAVFMEALSDAGVHSGLPRALATQLAVNTVYGTSKMLLNGDVASPSAIKEMVCSPGGTTIAGVYALEKGGFRATTMSGVQAATVRAKELSKL